jgi:excisionase family DNA binding protein
MKDRLSDYLTTREAADALGLTHQSVQKYCQRGVLKSTKKGRQVLLHQKEIDRYQKNRRPKGWPKSMKRTGRKPKPQQVV